MDLSGLEWIGHASFLLRIGKRRLYIDPFNLDSTHGRADLILITHPHFDHLSAGDIGKIADEKTQVFVPQDSVSKVQVGSVTGVRPGARYEALGIGFSTLPAYNVVRERLDKHPRENGWVGYVIGEGRESVYHAGDTDLIDEMRGLKVGTALLPMSGTYTMDVGQAIEATRAIGADRYIPMHYKQVLGKEGSEKAEELFRSRVKKAVFLKEVQEARYSF